MFLYMVELNYKSNQVLSSRAVFAFRPMVALEYSGAGTKHAMKVLMQEIALETRHLGCFAILL